MPWVRFTDNYDFWFSRTACKAYRKGAVQNVTTPCAELAIAAGKAESVKSPRSKKCGFPLCPYYSESAPPMTCPTPINGTPCEVGSEETKGG